MAEPKGYMSKKRIIYITAAAALAALCVALYPLWNYLYNFVGISGVYTECGEYPFAVYFFDVGSGNAVLISCEGTNILVDSGREKAQYDTVQRLESAGVDTIDLLVLTHPDKDHIGDMENVLESFEVGRFITCQNGDYDLTSSYTSLMKTAEAVGADVEYVASGEEIVFGELTLSVVSPTKVYDTSNDNSVAMRVVYKDFSLFLPGDMSEAAERDVLSTDAQLS